MSRKKSTSPTHSARKHKTKKRGVAPPKTAEQFFAKSEQFQDRWNAIAHIISKMRADKLSLRQASREFGLDPRTVVRLGGSALRKSANGRYTARRSDRLLRVLAIPTARGMGEIAIRGSREASRLGQYSSALKRYLQTGDASALLKFQNQSIKAADGTLVPLITDLPLLRRLGGAGVVSFESLYGRTA